MMRPTDSLNGLRNGSQSLIHQNVKLCTLGKSQTDTPCLI